MAGYNGSVSSNRYKAIWRQERKDNPHLFKTIIIQRFETELEAKTREEVLHKKLGVVNNDLYINRAVANGKFGGSGDNSSRFGIRDSEKTRKKMSQAAKNRPSNRLGKTFTEESIQKIKESLTGRSLSEEHIQHLHKKHKPFSEVTRQKMRKPKSEAHKQKMREAWQVRKNQSTKATNPDLASL
jgi:hypothetical protein